MADMLNDGASMSPIEFQIQQQALDRQRKMAEYLQQSSMTPEQGQMVSGHYIAPSPMQYIAKLAQGLVGSSNQRALDQKQMDIARAQNQFMGDRAAELAKAVTPIAADPGQNIGPGDNQRQMAYMEHTGAAAPDMMVGAKPAYNPGQSDLNTAMIKYLTATGNAAKTPDLIIADAKQRMLVKALSRDQNGQGSSVSPGSSGSSGGATSTGLDPRLEAELMAQDPTMKSLMDARVKAAMPTEANRTLMGQGIDMPTAGKLTLAEMRSKGLVQFQPNVPTIDPLTGKTVIAADYKNAIQGGVDAQGNPIMGGIPGGNVLAQMEGDKARSVASAQSGFKTQIVPTQGGQRLMTDEQIIAATKGGGQSPDNFPSVAPEVQRQRDAQAIGIAQQEVASARTPQERQQAQQALDVMVARFSAGQSVITGTAKASPGIALETPESQAFATKVATGAGEDLLKNRDKAKGAADDLLSINESRKAIASGAFLGAGADMKTDMAKAIKGWIGVDIDANKVTNSEYLRSTLGQRMLDNAKKLGINPTDNDARRLDVIIGTIAKDPHALNKALDFQEEMAKRAITQHNANVSQAEKNGLKSPYDLTVQIPSFSARSTGADGWSNLRVK